MDIWQIVKAGNGPYCMRRRVTKKIAGFYPGQRYITISLETHDFQVARNRFHKASRDFDIELEQRRQGSIAESSSQSGAAERRLGLTMRKKLRSHFIKEDWPLVTAFVKRLFQAECNEEERPFHKYRGPNGSLLLPTLLRDCQACLADVKRRSALRKARRSDRLARVQRLIVEKAISSTSRRAGLSKPLTGKSNFLGFNADNQSAIIPYRKPALGMGHVPTASMSKGKELHSEEIDPFEPWFSKQGWLRKGGE